MNNSLPRPHYIYVFAYLERAGKRFQGGGVLPADLILFCVRVSDNLHRPNDRLGLKASIEKIANFAMLAYLRNVELGRTQVLHLGMGGNESVTANTSPVP